MWQPFFSDQMPSHDHDLTSFDLSTSRIVSIIILIILCRHVAYQLKTAVLHWKCNADVSSFHLICKMPIFKWFWIFQFFELGIWLQGQTRSRTLKRCQIRKIIGQNRGSWTSMWALSNENCGLSPPPRNQVVNCRRPLNRIQPILVSCEALLRSNLQRTTRSSGGHDPVKELDGYDILIDE